MEFQEICNLAGRDLPEGWQLRICLEDGTGWVELVDPDGETCVSPDFPDASLEDRIKLHVSTAALFDFVRRNSGWREGGSKACRQKLNSQSSETQ